MPLCRLCLSLDILNVPTLPADYSSFSVPSRTHPTQIDIYNSRLATLYRKDSTALPDLAPLGLPFHQSVAELATSATSCEICSVIHHNVTEFVTEMKDAGSDKGPDWRMWIARGAKDTGGFLVISRDSKKWHRIWVVAAVGLCVDCTVPGYSVI